MGIVFELAIVIAVAYLAGRVVPPWLRDRARLRAEREAHRRRLDLLGKTDDVVNAMLTDRELARDVHEKLGRLLAEGEKEKNAPEVSADEAGASTRKPPSTG